MSYGALGTDIYYGNEEAKGYTVLAQWEDHTRSYEFDIAMFFKSPDGRFFAGRDSGCSCPSPFETFSGCESFMRVFNVADVREAVGDSSKNEDEYDQNPDEKFFSEVEKAFKENANA